MKKELIFVLFVGLLVLGFDYPRPDRPSVILEAEVVSVKDAPKGGGWREVAVLMPGGETRFITTLAPFFYKPGYVAFVGIFERRFFPDVLDVVSPPNNPRQDNSGTEGN